MRCPPEDGYGFVFEDDAMPLSDDISAALTRLSEMADQLDIVSLANRRPKLKREKIAVCSENTALYALRGNDIGAEAYFINSDADSDCCVVMVNSGVRPLGSTNPYGFPNP